VLGVKGGRGLERTEVEVEIDAGTFDELWGLAGARRIDKTRYRLPAQVIPPSSTSTRGHWMG
jgi:hypothetical protein